ncbi:unnamed protein product [Pieris macdunnoughi]|uniref:Peptidase S1 domain-containing protein n=1 Tax=Pieris macdunnoughi TaxID=345717 RepID=A0A821XHP8_9NEOP|nr:unnamed protein product [Pieris macdunnoughi]
MTRCLLISGGKGYQGGKEVPLPIVDHGTCEWALQHTRLGMKFRLDNTLICAGGRTNFDTCTGDGGASLVCRTSSAGGTPRYSVYGMVAFGVGCGTQVPAAYVNVAAMYQWITDKFAEENLDVPFYA